MLLQCHTCCQIKKHVDMLTDGARRFVSLNHRQKMFHLTLIELVGGLRTAPVDSCTTHALTARHPLVYIGSLWLQQAGEPTGTDRCCTWCQRVASCSAPPAATPNMSGFRWLRQANDRQPCRVQHGCFTDLYTTSAQQGRVFTDNPDSLGQHCSQQAHHASRKEGALVDDLAACVLAAACSVGVYFLASIASYGTISFCAGWEAWRCVPIAKWWATALHSWQASTCVTTHTRSNSQGHFSSAPVLPLAGRCTGGRMGRAILSAIDTAARRLRSSAEPYRTRPGLLFHMRTVGGLWRSSPERSCVSLRNNCGTIFKGLSTRCLLGAIAARLHRQTHVRTWLGPP
jgi:hypothetical protein